MATSLDLKSDLQEALQAIEILERLYPGHNVIIQPKAQENNGSAARFEVAPEVPRRCNVARTLSVKKKTPAKRKSIRTKVREAAVGKTIREMVEETGLTKQQVRGVVNAPAEKDSYEKEELPSGEMRYTYSG